MDLCYTIKRIKKDEDTGVHFTPGDITILRKIHIKALKCSVAAHLVYEYSEYRYDRIGIPADKKEYYMLLHQVYY